jgi:hypothetical protein
LQNVKPRTGEDLPGQLNRSKHDTPSRFARLALPSLCLGALLVLASCRPLFQREVSGAVLSLEGSAQGTLDGKTVRLTTNDWIHPGEKIATAAGSRVDLMILPGILVELAGETEIEIIRLRFARDGDETIRPMTAREASLRLIRGTLIASVGQSQTRSRIFIQTRAGDLTAFDLRTFKIEVDGDRARVMSVRGKMTFAPAPGGAPVKINAGYFAEWPAMAAAPRAAAESDATVQAEVPRLLRVEKRLFRLQKEYGSGFIPRRR